MRHGSTHLLTGAAHRRALGDTLFLFPGPRFHQARRLGEDPRRDYRVLPRKILRRYRRHQEGRSTAGLSLPPSLKRLAERAAVRVTTRDATHSRTARSEWPLSGTHFCISAM